MKENTRDNLNTLKEMLLDERKLLTYVSLSKELCIHVNESKSLLNTFLEDLRKNHKDVVLNINYIVSGLLDDNKAQTVVCIESQLPGLLSQFKKVFFQHLYSICVGTPAVDNVSLMAVNKFEDFPLCTGLIKSDLCMKRPADEIKNLKANVQETSSNEQKPMKAKASKVKEESKKISCEDVLAPKVQRTSSEPIVKTEFPKKETLNGNIQKTDSKNNKTNQKGIAGFFNKASGSKKTVNGIQDKNTGNLTEDKEIENKVIKVEKMEVDDDDYESKIDSPKRHKSESNATAAKKKKQNHSKSNNSLEQIKKTAKVDKKRKRVLHVSDSESEEEKNDPFSEEAVIEPESDDEIPPTPLVNTVKITSGIVNPKKKRKIVDKTYTDEDGYVLTKKEEVYESCSDNEDEPNVKENTKSFNKVTPVKNEEVSPPKEKKSGIKNKKKMNSPQKGKQATLMNFFKKV